MITQRHSLLFWTLALALLAALLCGCASFEHDHRVLSCKIEDLYCDSPDVQVVLAGPESPPRGPTGSSFGGESPVAGTAEAIPNPAVVA